MKASNKTVLRYEVTLTLSEIEARALIQLHGYGTETFLDCFYKHLGRSYLEPYEGGIRSLFNTIPEQLGPELYKIDRVRKLLEKQSEAGGSDADS